MARNTSPQGSKPRADASLSQWDDAGWDQDHDHDEAAGRRARRLLSSSNSGFHRLADRLGALRRWLAGERWVKRLAVAISVLMVIFAGCFGGLWWRLGAGPINLDMATPWLAAAIEENIGHGNTVEVGGTQIERAGRIRIAVRIRDIIVRDRDHAIVASAPKAEVRLSGSALLMGRLRAESLNLVDAELSVRITPDGYVTVSTGDTAKPLATGVTSKKDAGLAPTFPRQIPGAPVPGVPAGVRRSLTRVPVAYLCTVVDGMPLMAPALWTSDGPLSIVTGVAGFLGIAGRAAGGVVIESHHAYRATRMVGAYLRGTFSAQADAKGDIAERYGIEAAIPGLGLRFKPERATWWRGFDLESAPVTVDAGPRRRGGDAAATLAGKSRRGTRGRAQAD